MSEEERKQKYAEDRKNFIRGIGKGTEGVRRFGYRFIHGPNSTNKPETLKTAAPTPKAKPAPPKPAPKQTPKSERPKRPGPQVSGGKSRDEKPKEFNLKERKVTTPVRFKKGVDLSVQKGKTKPKTPTTPPTASKPAPKPKPKAAPKPKAKSAPNRPTLSAADRTSLTKAAGARAEGARANERFNAAAKKGGYKRNDARVEAARKKMMRKK